MPKSELVKPVKCACGARALVYVPTLSSLFFVYCWRSACWSGPNRKTRVAAIAAWNRAMRPRRKGAT